VVSPLRIVASMALLASSVAFAAGCSKSGAARLEGKWKGSRVEGVAPDSQAAATTFAAATEIDVKGDSILVVTPKDHESGHFKVVKEDKTSVTIVTDKDGPGDAQVFTFVDDKTMKWAVLEGKTITFVKQ
jgi:hypothetical protein